MVNSSGLEKIYTLTDGRTDIQKSDLYSEVALAKNSLNLATVFAYFFSYKHDRKLKSEINSSIWSTKTLLYDIKELRYKLNDEIINND